MIVFCNPHDPPKPTMRCCARSFQQQGLASLLITVVLVLAATLLALTLNRTTIAEYVMLRNQKAQQQAFANASTLKYS